MVYAVPICLVFSHSHLLATTTPTKNYQHSAHHESFHPIWGQLLKTGYQNSRYGHQIDRFACLYTSHVSNMAFYSPDTAYSGKGDLMAHEVGFVRARGKMEGGCVVCVCKAPG